MACTWFECMTMKGYTCTMYYEPRSWPPQWRHCVKRRGPMTSLKHRYQIAFYLGWFSRRLKYVHIKKKRKETDLKDLVVVCLTSILYWSPTLTVSLSCLASCLWTCGQTRNWNLSSQNTVQMWWHNMAFLPLYATKTCICRFYSIFCQ